MDEDSDWLVRVFKSNLPRAYDIWITLQVFGDTIGSEIIKNELEGNSR